MRQHLAPLMFLALFAACSPDIGAFALKNTSEAERQFAKNVLQLISDAQTDSLVALLSADIPSDTVRSIMPALASVMASVDIDSLHVIGANINQTVGTNVREVNLSYEGPTRDGDGWVACNVAVRYDGEHAEVVGFNVYPLSSSLESQHAFTLANRPARHYLWLAFALLVPVCTIGTAVHVARARVPRRWLWAAVALIATPVFALNWSSGEVSTQIARFVLFGGAAFRPGPTSPWILSFGLPTGALLAYLRVRRWRKSLEVPPVPTSIAT